MRRTREFGLVALGLLSVLIAAELGMRATADSVPEPSDWPTPESHLKSVHLAELDGQVDVLFLGSSISEAAVDPEIVADGSGFSVYNSAMPFMTPASFEAWYSEVARDLVSPDLVVLGLPTWPFVDQSDALADGIRQAVDQPAVVRLEDVSELVMHRGLLADWDLLMARSRLLGGGQITDLGHQTGYYEKVNETFAGLEGVARGATMSDFQETALERTVESVRADNGEVVILLEPSAQPETPEVDAYHAWIRQRAQEWGVPVWDMHGMAWDHSWFADDVHFNRAGTVAFSGAVADLIEEDLRAMG